MRSTRQTAVASYGSAVLVPESTRWSSADADRRFHTNHLVRLGPSDSGGSPSGYTPQQIAVAYGVPTPISGGAGAIAIVDAFDDPNALNDFNEFSTYFGLPTEPSSTPTASSNQYLQVVYATGQEPQANASWSQEISGDIEWAHAMAPQAKIYLVEAASDSTSDIMAAVSTAKALSGVREVSMSFGSPETACSIVDDDSIFVQSGVAFFAATGDEPAVRDYPATSSNVVAVGGTTLELSSSGDRESETVWQDTGCGPSAYEPRPVFQDQYYSTVGLYRAACDVVAEADPNTGVDVYDSFAYQGASGWLVLGGTSVASPIMAGIVNSSGVDYGSSQSLNTVMYSLASSSCWNKITSGSAGGYSGGSPWGFASGLGSPNGLASALSSASSSVRLRTRR